MPRWISIIINPPFSFEVGQRPVQHADNADFVTGETGVWGFSA